ncbi:hypothetical protein D3C87_2113770 [compost metagenome]
MRDEFPQLGDVAQNGRDMGRVAATRCERVDLGGQVGDLVLEASIAGAGSVLRQP